MRWPGWIAVAVVMVACRSAAGPAAPVEDDGECTPDARVRGVGIHPAAGTTLRGTVGIAMRAVLTVVAPDDDTVELAVGGPLPAGLTIRCGTEGCRIARGSRGCVVIAGTPAEAARTTLRVETQPVRSGSAPPPTTVVYRVEVVN